MYPFIAFPPPSLFSLKIFSQIEKLKFSSESNTTNLRGCSATGITNCASRMFDFPSSRPHFRMEMEARSIELALEEGLEPVRNRRWGRFNDLHLEIVAGTHTHTHTHTNTYIRVNTISEMNFSFVFFNQVYSLLFDTSIRVERHCATLSFTAEERLCHVSVFLANTVVDFFFFFFFQGLFSYRWFPSLTRESAIKNL